VEDIVAEAKPYSINDIAQSVSAILSSQSIDEENVDELIDPEEYAIELATMATEDLLDTMLGFACIGVDNLTEEQNINRKMIATELKSRAADDSL